MTKSNDELSAVNESLQHEISLRKQKEKECERLTLALHAKTAELEKFIYTISHDLRSPLLTIAGFANFMEIDAADGNLVRVKSDAQHIQNAIDKMNNLLEKLLCLSRIGRMDNVPEAVSMEALAREAVLQVSGLIAKVGIRVEIHTDMPVVFVDKKRYLQVMYTLIDNAVRYMGSQPESHIEIGARMDSEETVCYVRDNGIGIEPCNRDKIFNFCEMRNDKTGCSSMGLAVAKRIIELHGGRIWVESGGEGQGCTFCFTVQPHNNTVGARCPRPL